MGTLDQRILRCFIFRDNEVPLGALS